MKRNPRKFQVYLFVLAVFLASLSGAVLAAEESITVTTYYPSPYGVYSEMRLYPKLEAQATTCDQNHEGLMFYDRVMHAMRVCRCINTSCIMTDDFTYSATNYWTLSGTNLYPNDLAWNVGIGTMTPNAGLHVNKASAWTSSSLNRNLILAGTGGGSSAYLQLGYGGSTRWGIGSQGGYLFFFSTTNDGTALAPSYRMTISDMGNVGIGTTNPGTRLSVRVDGNGANAVLRLSSILSSWTAGFGPRLLFHGGTDDRVFGEIGSFLQNTGTGANAYMTFSTRDSEVLGERMRITSTGNVGIWTTNPWARLESGGLAQDSVGFRTVNNAGTRHIFLVPQLGAGGYNWLSQAGDSGIFYNDAGGLVIGPWAGSSEGLRIDAAGNVGIGAIPDQKLTVTGGNVKASSAGGGGALYLVNDATTQKGWLGYQNWLGAGTGGLGIYNDAAAQQLALLSNGVLYYSGNVGIGSTGTAGYRLYVAGPVWATNFTPSDIRFKEDIAPIGDALGTITKLRGVSFRWKVKEYKEKGFVEGKHFGVIAQEAETVLPEVVREGPDDEKSVSYTELIPILINAVKELKQENDELKSRIKALEANLEKS